ncbi:secondary thiamine-phosphate synthase enzyme YjbQ [Anaerostipes sp.]|uniref:secondary thiamine-phosphate synthase enzyme YjbQ n=1 Tax=Anaerostipes sp. TaxID=1872530 RepID=UPI0025C6E93A|nr:secondary thiamine-phosphate synthase enzyme YjbQ [Anaerostipes sp.]MBS7006915.1 secondary thiamine-phosphate synthase enzyme YjbQ [Anaerostipes sp.]
MKQTFFEHHLEHTRPEDMIKITSYLKEDLAASGIKNGIAVIHSPHTTAGITINENADPDVVHDMLYGFDKIYPEHDSRYRHMEGNSHAHLKTSTVGPSQTVIIAHGKPVLGIWQDIYFCEFDGPRNRSFYIKIVDC